MEKEIISKISKIIESNLVDIILSNSTNTTYIKKIKVRPVRVKSDLAYQVTSYQGTKVFHKNYTFEELVQNIESWIDGFVVTGEDGSTADAKMKQMVIRTTKEQTNVLVSKKGKVTMKTSRHKEELAVPDASHNRSKKYIIPEGTPVPFLVDLGVMTKEGKIVHTKYDKYRQINRFLEFVEDIVVELPKEREVTILDFGCGKSYLTFALYYYLHDLKGYPIRIIGLDLKPDVIKTCSGLAKKYGYEKLTFLQGDIADYEGVNQVDMVVTLHACDTATDYALYKAVNWGAKVVLSVPCCQHELNKQMSCETLEPVLQYGLIKERMAALFTDGLRANLMEAHGYRTQILEFIDMEHTPKNILIRAVKQGGNNKKAKEEYDKLTAFLGVEPTLGRLFDNK